MNINDYKNAVSRMHANPELEKEVINMIEEKKKKRFSKKAVIPVAIAAVVGLSTFTVAFADDIARIFRKTYNFEMNIETVESDSDEALNVSIKKAVLKEWDENTLQELFMDGKTVVDSDAYPSDMTPNVTRQWSEFDDGSTLVWENGDVSWMYEDSCNYDYVHIISTLAIRNYDKSSKDICFKKDEIEGLDKNKCIETADNYINELGISVGQKQVFALDKDGLIQADGHIRNENGEVLPEWTEEQEAYLIVYSPCVDDVELSLRDNEVTVVIGRNGLVCLQAHWIYETVDTVETVEICSAEQAAETVYEHFYWDWARSPMEINKSRLIYKPKQSEDRLTYTLKPYWEFDSAEFSKWLNLDGTENEFNYYDKLLVDAQTGEYCKDNYS